MNNYFWVLLVLALYYTKAADVVLLTRQNEACQFGHDFIRDNHNVARLQWDEDLKYGAEDWAIRCALKNEMEHSSFRLGENIYMTPLNSVPCANPLRGWYNGIKDFDYDHPKWTWKDGTFIQEVYSTVSKFGIGTASFAHNAYVVGRYDVIINSAGPFDQKHIPKPKKNSISIDDLTPKPAPSPQYIEIKCPEVDGWTDWIQTGTCSAECGVGSVVEERWCVRLNDMKKCEGERKRTTSCEKTNCGSCKDAHKDCKPYANIKNYCNHPVYRPWMKTNCPNSCKFCTKGDAKKSVIQDEREVSKLKVIQNKVKAILL